MDNPNIHFMGFQPIGVVLENLRKAQAMIFCSEWYEGFPMTIIESMATGTPVLCADIGNHASIVKESGCGVLYKNRDVDDFLSAMERLSADRENIREKEIAVYNSCYTPEANYAQLKKIYEEVTKDRCGHNV